MRGGGNAGGGSGAGANGGSGVVIIKTTENALVTGNPQIITNGNFKIYRFTGSGTIMF